MAQTKTTKTAPAKAKKTDDVNDAPVEVQEEAVVAASDKKIAKAGKRSAKSVKEAEAAEAKAERKKQAEQEPKQPVARPKNPPRSKLQRRSKAYRKLAELIQKDKVYSLSEAVELATKTSPAKFDATLEIHINLNVDPKLSDQNVRDTVALPAGTGKTVTIAAFVEEADAASAKAAGADIVGADAILSKLEKNQLDFDVLVATPALMPKLGKYARSLGPRGLMPNPKSGTVTKDVASAVEQAKAGRVEYRTDAAGIVHVPIGKVSFGSEKLLSNAQAVMGSIRSNKPASVKTTFIKAVHLATTMGPSIACNPD